MLRVLHCPANVGGHPSELARAERALGLASRSVAFDPSIFGYATDETLWAGARGLLGREARRFALLRRALRDFDVIHFNFGLSIMPPWVPPGADPAGASRLKTVQRLYSRLLELRDLPLLKRAGKRIVVTFQGDDARQGDVLRERYEHSLADESGSYYLPAADAHKRRRIRGWERYADAILALNPDLLHVLPKHAQFLPYANVDPADWLPLAPPQGRPVIVHAPSHRGVKGTAHVIEAVRRLQAEGTDCELALVEGMPRADARAVYESAAIVVDQLLAGWYGGFAVEAMALGKPVVAHIRSADLQFVPRGMSEQLPVVDATPDTIYEVLRRLLAAPRDELTERGLAGRRYVETWHDPHSVAKTTTSLYAELCTG